MPHYACPLGTTVTADDAMSNGRLRPGYRSWLASGERASFDITLIDNASAAAIVALGDAYNPAAHGQSQPVTLAQVRDAARAGGADIARITADARADYQAFAARRKAAMQDAWKEPPAAIDIPSGPVVTGDAVADYAAAQAVRKAAMRDAWRGN